MKTLRIVILDEGGDAPDALRSGQLPGIDLRRLEGLSGADAAALLREHSMPAPFVDTGLDGSAGPPTDFGATDLEHELRSALQGQPGGQPMALLLGHGEASPASAAPAHAPLPFERLNTSLVRALRRHELEAALAESDARARRIGLVDRQTALASRELFLDRLEQASASVMRGGAAFATLMIGFDWPDGLAEQVSPLGAEVLIETLARRLYRLGRRSDSYARIGGHSFAALLLGNNSVGGSTAMAQKIAEQLARPVMVDGRSVDPAVHLGVVLCPQHGSDARSLLLHAQAAMEQAQHARQAVAVYDARHERRAATPAAATPLHRHRPPGEDTLALLLTQAIERDEIGLAFQPVVDLQRGADGGLDWSLRRLEALARWHSPLHGPIAPAAFIPVAVHHALIAPLTDRVLNRALALARPWREQGLVPALSINLAEALLEDPDLPVRFEAALQRNGWPGAALRVEIAATALARPGAQAQDVLARLGQLGVQLVVDDLGSGLGAYLALADLGQLAELKLDLRALQRNAVREGQNGTERSLAVLRSLLTLAEGLGAQVVAKGVEDAGTAAWLLDQGCHAAQGYAWSRPLPAEQVRGWCSAHLPGHGPRH